MKYISVLADKKKGDVHYYVNIPTLYLCDY